MLITLHIRVLGQGSKALRDEQEQLDLSPVLIYTFDISQSVRDEND